MAVGAGIRYLEEIIKRCDDVGSVYHVSDAGGRVKIELMPSDENATVSVELVRETALYVLKKV